MHIFSSRQAEANKRVHFLHALLLLDKRLAYFIILELEGSRIFQLALSRLK